MRRHRASNCILGSSWNILRYLETHLPYSGLRLQPTWKRCLDLLYLWSPFRSRRQAGSTQSSQERSFMAPVLVSNPEVGKGRHHIAHTCSLSLGKEEAGFISFFLGGDSTNSSEDDCTRLANAVKGKGGSWHGYNAGNIIIDSSMIMCYRWSMWILLSHIISLSP